VSCICFITTTLFSRETQAKKFFRALDELQDSSRRFGIPECRILNLGENNEEDPDIDDRRGGVIDYIVGGAGC
jgi:hypothetical protein